MELKTWCAAERGRASKLAAAIGAPVPFMSQMVAGQRPVPPHYVPAIREHTGGEVMPWDLRPDDWRRIWPEAALLPGAPAEQAQEG